MAFGSHLEVKDRRLDSRALALFSHPRVALTMAVLGDGAPLVVLSRGGGSHTFPP